MRNNPYPGTREFSTDEQERFFGRREEIAILSGLVQARRVSLLFAQSGAGKSSLINAGLVPELTRERRIGRGRRRRTVRKMSVLGVAEVGGGVSGRLGRGPDNVFAFSALHSLFSDAEPDAIAGERLAAGIAPLLEEPGGAGPALLVFDQFEQLVTQHAERWPERLPFFEQVAEALDQHPRLHLLFSMREDFIAELTPFSGLLPGGLRDRFRLERLRPEPALAAVRRPALRAGCPFDEGVAEDLVDNLRRTQAGRAPADAPQAAEPRLGEFVEPVHLQIVCRQLWDNLDEGRTSIASADLRQLGDVDEALRGFYERALAQVLERTEVREHRLREWFETTNLITPARTRGLVYRDAGETAGLSNDAVDELVDTYLVRGSQRGTDTWYELAHDRLVEPILAANREWRSRHLKPVTVAAEAWEAAERDPRKLYSGAQLAEAEATVREDPSDYSELERKFITASADLEKQKRREEQRIRRLELRKGIAEGQRLKTLKGIGALGIVLPLLLVFGAMLFQGPGIEASLSDYYHTEMRDVLVGCLWTIAIFLLTYRGYDRRDDLAGNWASFFAIGTALFPTAPANEATRSEEIFGPVHYAFAAALFLTLAYFSLVVFRMGGGEPTPEKILRNRVYTSSGYIILACIAAIAAVFLLTPQDSPIRRLDPVFWLETCAVWAFGWSWFTKGGGILPDRQGKASPAES